MFRPRSRRPEVPPVWLRVERGNEESGCGCRLLVLLPAFEGSISQSHRWWNDETASSSLAGRIDRLRYPFGLRSSRRFDEQHASTRMDHRRVSSRERRRHAPTGSAGGGEVFWVALLHAILSRTEPGSLVCMRCWTVLTEWPPVPRRPS